MRSILFPKRPPLCLTSINYPSTTLVRVGSPIYHKPPVILRPPPIPLQRWPLHDKPINQPDEYLPTQTDLPHSSPTLKEQRPHTPPLIRSSVPEVQKPEYERSQHHHDRRTWPIRNDERGILIQSSRMARFPAQRAILPSGKHRNTAPQTPQRAPRRAQETLMHPPRPGHLHNPEAALLFLLPIPSIRPPPPRKPLRYPRLELPRQLRAEPVPRAEYPRPVPVPPPVEVAQQQQHLCRVAAGAEHDGDVRGLVFWVAGGAGRARREDVE